MISVTELDLLEFFAVEPRLTDPDVPWSYNDAVYEVAAGPLTLSFALAPAYGDVRIVVRFGDHPLYEFSALGVQDIRRLRDAEGERLEIRVCDAHTLLLWVSPRIRVRDSSNS